MDRRSFFRTMIGGVAAAAAVRTFPFRVFSFPTEVVGYRTYVMGVDAFLHGLTTIYYNKQALEALKENLSFEELNTRYRFNTNFGQKIKLFQYDLRAPKGLYVS